MKKNSYTSPFKKLNEYIIGKRKKQIEETIPEMATFYEKGPEIYVDGIPLFPKKMTLKIDNFKFKVELVEYINSNLYIKSPNIFLEANLKEPNFYTVKSSNNKIIISWIEYVNSNAELAIEFYSLIE
jgi:hypothetical protein